MTKKVGKGKSSEIINEMKVDILRMLDGEKTIYAIAEAIGLRYSTTHRHIITLFDNGFAVKNGNEKDAKWSRTKAGDDFLNAIEAGKKTKGGSDDSQKGQN